MSRILFASSSSPHRIASVALLVILSLWLGACGGGDDQPEAEQTAGSDLIPANLDTLITQTGSDLPENQYPEAGSDEQAAAPVADEAEPALQPVTQPEPEPALQGSGQDSGQETSQPVPAQPSQISGGAFSVQLGSFRKVDNARRLADRISAMGYPATVEKALVNGQTYHRVFVRGLASRAEAENLGEDLSRQLDIGYLVLRAN